MPLEIRQKWKSISIISAGNLRSYNFTYKYCLRPRFLIRALKSQIRISFTLFTKSQIRSIRDGCQHSINQSIVFIVRLIGRSPYRHGNVFVLRKNRVKIYGVKRLLRKIISYLKLGNAL
jgi:hypothetical protein